MQSIVCCCIVYLIISPQSTDFTQADKTDLGSFRFNDPERNIFFASTDMPGLSKAPLVYEKRRGARSVNKNKEKKLLPHYSVTTHGDALWGTHDVYADAIARSDRVKMQIHYE